MATYSDSDARLTESSMNQIGDFTQALFHSAVERPVNALVQIANNAVGANLPELEIAGAPNDSVGASAGSIAGSALNFYFLSKFGGKALGSLGGTGVGGQMLRMGIIGAMYEGVLSPSPQGTDGFWKDRLGSALVGGTTFAAMARTSVALDRAGWFAVPEVRSLGGSVAHGMLGGITAGLVHAEARAVFKEGKVLATLPQLQHDGITYGAFGATMGAIGYGMNKTFNRPVFREIEADKGWRARVQLDAEGKPVELKANYRSYSDDWRDTNLHTKKLTNGSWSRSGIEHIEDVTIGDGWIKFGGVSGTVHSFAPGSYTRGHHFYDQQAGDPRLTYERPDGSLVVTQDGAKMEWDGAAKLRYFKKNGNVANFEYGGENGQLNAVIIETSKVTGPYLNVRKSAGNEWDVHANHKGQTYRFSGDILVNGAEEAPSVTFRASDGSRAKYDLGGSVPTMIADIVKSSKY